MSALKEYLNAERGRLTTLAIDLGINPGAISQWTQVPAERVVAVEGATGIPRELLRPDLYRKRAKAS